MSTDYRQVLREMEAREAELLAELKDIQAAKPAIQRMAKAMPVALRPSAFEAAYASLGTKEAILLFLINQSTAKSSSEIAQGLLNGGIRTTSKDFAAVVKSTLATLKSEGKVERKEDGWVAAAFSPSDFDPSESLLRLPQ